MKSRELLSRESQSFTEELHRYLRDRKRMYNKASERHVPICIKNVNFPSTAIDPQHSPSNRGFKVDRTFYVRSKKLTTQKLMTPSLESCCLIVPIFVHIGLARSERQSKTWFGGKMAYRPFFTFDLSVRGQICTFRKKRRYRVVPRFKLLHCANFFFTSYQPDLKDKQKRDFVGKFDHLTPPTTRLPPPPVTDIAIHRGLLAGP